MHALRQIFGLGISAQKMRERGQIDLLSKRREELCLKFAQKGAKNPRFGSRWFPLKEQPKYARRSTVNYLIYEEKLAKTDKRRNSPLFYFRRQLNASRK